MRQQDGGYGAGAILLSFFIGGIIGAGVALLTAPKTGQETRKMIRDFAEDARDKAEDYAGQIKDKAEDYAGQIKGKAADYVEKGKEFIDSQKSIISKAVEAGKEAYDRERHG